jgi:Disulfide bond formation protein DsbB
MREFLYFLPRKALFWNFIIISMISLELIALYYQYALHESPCAICVQIRSVVMFMGFTGLFGLMVKNNKKLIWLPLLALLSQIGGVLILGSKALHIERGDVLSTCGMDAGFPVWMKLDQWLPWMFEPKGLCGKAIQLIPGVLNITMVEALYYGFIAAMIGYVSILVIYLFSENK